MSCFGFSQSLIFSLRVSMNRFKTNIADFYRGLPGNDSTAHSQSTIGMLDEGSIMKKDSQVGRKLTDTNGSSLEVRTWYPVD